MADIRSCEMSADDLLLALGKVPEGAFAYLLQRLYDPITLDRFELGSVDLDNCMDGRAFGDAGEVTWQRLEGDRFQVCAVWDGGARPGGFAGGVELPHCAGLDPKCASVFLWGTRFADDADGTHRWFEARVARAKLKYPLDPCPPGETAYRVKVEIVRYLCLATGDLVTWRMKGLKAVSKQCISRPPQHEEAK